MTFSSEAPFVLAVADLSSVSVSTELPVSIDDGQFEQVRNEVTRLGNRVHRVHLWDGTSMYPGHIGLRLEAADGFIPFALVEGEGAATEMYIPPSRS